MMLKKHLYYLLVLICGLSANAQNYQLMWRFQGNVSADGIGAVQALDTDASGNVYITGFTVGNLDLRGTAASNNGRINSDKRQAYIAKYSPQGQLLWQKTLPTTSFSIPNDIHIDGQAVYVHGVYKGALTIGSKRFSSTNDQANFLCRVDANNGNFIWAQDSQSAPIRSTFGLHHFVGDGRGNLYVYTRSDHLCRFDKDGNATKLNMGQVSWQFRFSTYGLSIDQQGRVHLLGVIPEKDNRSGEGTYTKLDGSSATVKLPFAPGADRSVAYRIILDPQQDRVADFQLMSIKGGGLVSSNGKITAFVDADQNAYFMTYSADKPADGSRFTNCLSKFDPNGKLLWRYDVPGYLESAAIAANGEVMLTYSRWDDVDKAYWVVFVHRLDVGGKRIWNTSFPARNANGSYGWAEFRSSCGTANVFGRFDRTGKHYFLYGEIAAGTINIDFAGGNTSLQAGSGSQSDLFLVKYDTGQKGRTITNNTGSSGNMTADNSGNNARNGNNNTSVNGNNNRAGGGVGLPSFVGCAQGNEVVPADNAAYEQRVLELVNQERRRNGLPALTWSESLAQAARYHAADMATDDYFEHDSYDRVNGRLVKVCDTFERIRRFGHGLAENIAGTSTPEAAMRLWMDSPGHRANILSRNTTLGVGYYQGYWVQVFGR
jgi:uncharacterized protein YkwD